MKILLNMVLYGVLGFLLSQAGVVGGYFFAIIGVVVILQITEMLP